MSRTFPRRHSRLPPEPKDRPTAAPASFFTRVYAFVAAIPRGRVVTYGDVARHLGVLRGARAVGWALRALPPERERDVPWHRVVGAGGRIAQRAGPGPDIQRRLLRAEKVRFLGGRVNMARHALGDAGQVRVRPAGRRPRSTLG